MGATQIKLATNGGVSAVYSPLDIDQFTDEELETAVWALSVIMKDGVIYKNTLN